MYIHTHAHMLTYKHKATHKHTALIIYSYLFMLGLDEIMIYEAKK